MKFCEEQCGKDAECDYEVCPFEHEYTEKDEVMSGYRYIGDSAYDKKIEWAKDFQKNHNCNSCPFVKNEVDIGVGILRDCDLVCKMEISGILKESVRQKDSRHGTHRVKSKNLSVREYFDEAQHDLNVYAREKGWKRV